MCDCSPPAFSRETTVRARKSHTCFDCEKEIKPGELYVYYVTKSAEPNGEMMQHRQCLDCQADMKELTEILYEETGEACICAPLDEVISEAMGDEILSPEHRLVQKWLPEYSEEYQAQQAKEAEEDAGIFWLDSNRLAVLADAPGQGHFPFWEKESATAVC